MCVAKSPWVPWHLTQKRLDSYSIFRDVIISVESNGKLFTNILLLSSMQLSRKILRYSDIYKAARSSSISIGIMVINCFSSSIKAARWLSFDDFFYFDILYWSYGFMCLCCVVAVCYIYDFSYPLDLILLLLFPWL